MRSLLVLPVSPQDEAVEIVERKGLGHPDTICDALAETLSRNLCREYRARFGSILHHNVDKALLRGGRASPAFGGGRVDEPIDIYLAGRATAGVGRDAIPIAEIATESAKAWLRANLHAVDVDRHVRVYPLLRPGSQELRSLYDRRAAGQAPLANDTSIGVGYAPLSSLEKLVLAVERRINLRPRDDVRAAWGEDVKVMGVRIKGEVELTVSCALIGAHLENIDAYLAEKAAIKRLAREEAQAHEFASCRISVNAADAPAAGQIFLTVTGTSAEAGDDGQVGRGNRANGLITPGRPMSIEAAAGKNPVTHVGKIYNLVASEIAREIVTALPWISRVRCLMVSRIGAPITDPAIVVVNVETAEGRRLAGVKPQIDAMVSEALAALPDRVDDFLSEGVAPY